MTSVVPGPGCDMVPVCVCVLVSDLQHLHHQLALACYQSISCGYNALVHKSCVLCLSPELNWPELISKVVFSDQDECFVMLLIEMVLECQKMI